VTRSLLIPFI
jgi:isocitrate/isopropylmalate dehydrogenase